VDAAIGIQEYFFLAKDTAVFVVVPDGPPEPVRELALVELDDHVDVVGASVGDPAVLGGDIRVGPELYLVFQ
jgi:hypothetical protein